MDELGLLLDIRCCRWSLSCCFFPIDESLDISVFGRCVYLALIARRSNHFAGTRFLKRGANHEVGEFCCNFLFCVGGLKSTTKLSFSEQILGFSRENLHILE